MESRAYFCLSLSQRSADFAFHLLAFHMSFAVFDIWAFYLQKVSKGSLGCFDQFGSSWISQKFKSGKPLQESEPFSLTGEPETHNRKAGMFQVWKLLQRAAILSLAQRSNA